MRNRRENNLICKNINQIRLGKRKLRDFYSCNYQTRLNTPYCSTRGHRQFPTTAISTAGGGWMRSGAEGRSYVLYILSVIWSD